MYLNRVSKKVVYGSIENAGINLRKFNWDKPYIVSEWGVNGPFEARKTSRGWICKDH